ncbi:MAG TPA: cyclic nucleotide-binding domain-containing protein [Desulfurivibrionaceae bacterium]|nr:cyclic nucleotide-binding domain-containing protein [Desulfurivibrionaceae bacterium]
MRESAYLEGQDHLVARIKVLPAFAAFDDRRLKELLRLCKICTYESGEIVIQEGEREQCMYFLFSGSVQVSKGGKVISTLRRTGDVFGEMSLVDGSPRFATVRAVGETTCLAVDASQLEQRAAKDGAEFQAAMYKMFAHILTQRLRDTTEDYLEVRQELEQVKKIVPLPTKG